MHEYTEIGQLRDEGYCINRLNGLTEYYGQQLIADYLRSMLINRI